MTAKLLSSDGSNQVQLSLGGKLRLARSLIGLSTRAVAKKLEPKFSISHATIANYEKSDSVPPMDVLVALAALYDRPITWFLERSTGLFGVKYRNLKSRTKSSDLLRFEAETQQWLDAYVAVERKLNRPLRAEVSVSRISSDPVVLAQDVRRAMGISDDAPIVSMVEVLERFGVRVIEIPTDLRIDGLAAQYDAGHVVALNPTVSNDRVRLNAAHELAHILFGDCDANSVESSPEQERRAFAFGSALLLPNRQLKMAFEGYSMVRLVQFKERFGISLAAMIYRAEQLGFISKPTTKKLWIEFAKRGWKTKEPGRVNPDKATRFEQMLDELISSGVMSAKEVADLCGTKLTTLRARIDFAMGIRRTPDDPEVQTFLFPTGQ